MNKKQILFTIFLLYLATLILVILLPPSVSLLNSAVIALIILGIVGGILGAIIGTALLYGWLGD